MQECSLKWVIPIQKNNNSIKMKNIKIANRNNSKIKYQNRRKRKKLIHLNYTLSWLGTGTAIKSGRIKLVLFKPSLVVK
jgi:hypothetical protein